MNSKKEKEKRHRSKLQYKKAHHDWKKKKPCVLCIVAYIRWRKQEPRCEDYV